MGFKFAVTELPDLTRLTHDEKDALIRVLWAQVQMLTTQVQSLMARVAELEAQLAVPPKTPDNSSMPPSQGQKPNQGEKPQRRVRGKAAWAAKAVAGRWQKTPTRR